MPTTNENLLKAQATDDNNEFYTLLPDIENELAHYERHFRDKVVYCNCDDPLESNFFVYFVKNFKKLGLKKLITTCYDGSPVAGTQLELPFAETKVDPKRVAHKIVVTDVTDFSRTNEEINFWDVKDALLNGSEKAKLEKLEGDKTPHLNKKGEMCLYGAGDFQSEECVELLKEADIVVTNPPFSLFSEYVSQIMEHGKKFLIVGRLTVIVNKDIFPYIKARTVWCGCNSGEMKFYVPADIELTESSRSGIDENGQKWKSMGNAFWLTNLEHDVKIEPLQLTAKYTPKDYPKFDFYDAIFVSGGKGIPDYDGVIGVPTTAYPKICPEQFDIVGCTYSFGRPDFWPENTRMTGMVNGEEKVRYLLIQKKKS